MGLEGRLLAAYRTVPTASSAAAGSASELGDACPGIAEMVDDEVADRRIEGVVRTRSCSSNADATCLESAKRIESACPADETVDDVVAERSCISA
jgi:hypothetical protein